MTKEQANAIKKYINSGSDRYTTFYVSKKEVLRVRAYSCHKVEFDQRKEQEMIAELLNKVSGSGYRPQFEIERRTYQGFLHDTNVILH